MPLPNYILLKFMITEKRNETLRERQLDLTQFDIEPYCAITDKSFSKKNVGFFDNDMKFRIIPLTEAYGIVKDVYIRDDGSCFSFFDKGHVIGDNDLLLFRKAVCQMKDGDSYEHLLQLCSNVKYIIHNDKPVPWIERFVALIEKPYFERETGNFNKKTFDFVRIRVHLNDLAADTKKAVQDNYLTIMKMVLEKIENNRTFQKYNVPVNCLKVTKVTITQQKVLEILFELKSFPDSDEDRV